MNNILNKNPDYLLTLVKKEESKEGQGRLKIFLGMVAGVGKTYAMLQSAQQLQANKIDVVIGLVETHGRKETAALLKDLEVIPRKKILHRHVEIEELDVEGILARKPKVVLVDELAHSNAPTCRHHKRYRDVFDLLDAGIDVLTTVNVQHIESRADTVRQITNVTVQETIPDSVFDRADEVVLIDLPPEELLNRLKSGLVYTKENADLAAKNFFQVGNLTALREMALRIAAERVDRELREYKALHGIEGAWKAGGRLMVAVFGSPYSEALIRWTRRVSDLLGVTWIGAYVENDKYLSDEEKSLLSKNIDLVHQLGGEIVSTRDDDAVKGLVRIAHQNNVTQIIIGKSQRSGWKNLFKGGSVVNRLLKMSGEIDVYVVSTDRGKVRRLRRNPRTIQKIQFPFDEMGWLFATAFGTWVVAAGLQPYIGYLAVGIIFLLSVSISGLFFSRLSVFLLALIFAVLHNFFFIPPVHTLGISKPEDYMLLAMFFIAAAVIGHLTSRLSQKERVIMSREDRAMTLYNLVREVAASQTASEVVESGVERLREIIDAEVGIFIPSSQKDSLPLTPSNSNTFQSKSPNEPTVASWVFEHGKVAGRSTETLSAAEATYFPIFGKVKVLGVLAIKLKDKDELNPDQRVLIETFLHQIAAGIEREEYHERIRSLLVVEETQKLYKSLLDCVSHELKTPLAAIKGSASALLDEKTASNKAAVTQLSSEILGASGRLQRLVENLLDMTRIESGMLKPKREACEVQDLVGAVLPRLESVKGTHPVKVSVPSGLAPVICDPVLVDQALGNILHNAFVYTPNDSEVNISAAESDDGMLEIQIRDHGPGLPKDHPERVLDKFYRATPQNAGGVGLGLSIAKGFIEAQGGKLKAQNSNDGAVFSIFLPKGSFA